MSEPSAQPGISALVRTALRGTFRFSGRSGRAELIAYLMFQLLVGGLIRLVASFFLDRYRLDVLSLALGIALALPTIALIVRRLHDLDAPAALAIPVFALAAYNTGMSIVGLVQGAERRLAAERILWPLDRIAVVIVVGAVVLVAAPGSKEANRFGPTAA